MIFFKRKPLFKMIEVELDCDLILKQIGGTGLFQVLNFFLLCLPAMVSGFLVLSFIVTGTFFQIPVPKEFHMFFLNSFIDILKAM